MSYVWTGQEDYYRYLESPEWKSLRLKVLKRDKGRCQDCRAKATEVHHLTYERVTKEALEDLVSLCCRCHRRRHGHGPTKYEPSCQVPEVHPCINCQPKEARLMIDFSLFGGPYRKVCPSCSEDPTAREGCHDWDFEEIEPGFSIPVDCGKCPPCRVRRELRSGAVYGVPT